MAEDFVEHAAPPFADSPPGAVDGPQAMRGTVEWLVSQFPDIHMRSKRWSLTVTSWSPASPRRGTNTGKLNGFLPPSGKRFRAQQSHWFRVQDDKLAEHWATR